MEKGFLSKAYEKSGLSAQRKSDQATVPLVVITPVLTSYTADSILEIVPYCHERDMGMDIQALYPTFGRAKNHPDLSLPVEEELAVLTEFARKVCEYPLPYVNLSDQPPLVLAYLNKACGEEVFEIYDCRCEFFKDWPPYPYVCILWDGSVIPCSYDSRPFQSHSLLEKGLLDLFQSPPAPFMKFKEDLKLRSKHASQEPSICVGCYYFNKKLCMQCPLPDPADVKHERCPAVFRLDPHLCKNGG